MYIQQNDNIIIDRKLLHVWKEAWKWEKMVCQVNREIVVGKKLLMFGYLNF